MQSSEVQKQRQPGRGFLITGMVLMALSFLGVGATVAILGPRVDLNDFSRDVAINGQLESGVPGQIGFRIIESLSSDDDTMTVGVAVSSSSTAIECEVVDVQGNPTDVRRGSSADTFVSADVDTSWTVVVVAEDLDPGEYSARCDLGGEPSEAAGSRFTVGRILTTSEVFDLFGPALGVLVAVVVGGLAALTGLILLIVGVVRRNKANKQPPAGGPPGAWPASGGPPQSSGWGNATPPGPPPAPPTSPPPVVGSPWEPPQAGSPWEPPKDGPPPEPPS